MLTDALTRRQQSAQKRLLFSAFTRGPFNRRKNMTCVRSARRLQAQGTGRYIYLSGCRESGVGHVDEVVHRTRPWAPEEVQHKADAEMRSPGVRSEGFPH